MATNENKIRKLLADLESDCVERTISTTNTDKFGQAICAFANDLPNNNRPGFLILGAEDNGKIHPLQVTDELLKNIAAIRTDGNIQPQPSMTVQKVSLEEGDIIVVEVHPAKFPPVKYKGRIWVRIGPRRGIANEDDERRLYEKRAANITTFDAMPCIGATLDDLDLAVFKQQYLPKAIPEDVLQEDKRDVEWQLQSLGFFDKRYNCPTYAGILFFGKQVEHFLPGAYIQYVRFSGKGRAGEIKNEYKNATHYCYAFTLVNDKGFSDDGEPNKTAGLPILQLIESEDLVNVIVVVVRYFGGIKLGPGGLIRAYSMTTREVINKSKTTDLVHGYEVSISFSYALEKAESSDTYRT